MSNEMDNNNNDDDGYKSNIQKWLMQWREQARQHGSKLEFVYGKALKTLREHPNPIKSSGDYRKLKNFGPKICEKIDKEFTKLNIKIIDDDQQQQTITDKLPVAIRSKRPLICTPKPSSSSSSNILIARNSPPLKVTKIQRNWIPTPGQIPFAILIALLRRHIEFDDCKVNKLDLQDMAELYTQTRPLILGNALNTLINKRQLVNKTTDRNARYFLTDKGRKLAIQLAKQCPMLKDFCDRFFKLNNNNGHLITDYFDFNDDDRNKITQKESNNFILNSGMYDIVLCIDTRERYSDRNGTQNRTAFPAALQQKGVAIEIRTLPLGDFVWIAREKSNTNDNDNNNQQVRRELVLDYIIERKRIDDLASSIKSNRWNEQKYRLKQSGIRNPMYLIEYMGKKSKKQDYGFLSSTTLDQAISNCEIDGFEVKITENFDDTIQYLTNLTKYLKKFYQNKSIISCQNQKQFQKTNANDLTYMTFNEFSINSSKITIFTAKEMFIKHLLQIRGLSLKKIQALIEKYPTIRGLFETIQFNDQKKCLELLTNIKYDDNRRLGPAISKKIYHFYCK